MWWAGRKTECGLLQWPKVAVVDLLVDIRQQVHSGAVR
jgi:hypothetical protein